MQHLRNGIRSAVFGAVATAGVWWSLNRMYTINDVGFLARQDGLLGNIYLCAGIGALVGFAVGVVSSHRRRDHFRAIAELSAELGCTYLPEVARTDVEPWPLVADWSSGTNGMIGKRQGVSFQVVDCETVEGEERTWTSQTLVFLAAEGVPDMVLQPRGFWQHVLGWAGLAGIEFDAAALPGEDAATVARFVACFYLTTAGLTAAAEQMTREPETDPKEEAVRRLLTPALMRQLLRFAGYSVHVRGGRLAVGRGSSYLPAHQRPQLLAAALDIRSTLTAAAAGPAPASVVPLLSAQKLSRRRQRSVRTLIGGVAGLGLGFFTGVFSSDMFFSHHLDEVLETSFLSFPFLMLGGAVLGGVVGGVLAALLPITSLLPQPTTETPEEKIARQKAGTVGAAFGAAFGLGAGFLISLVLLFLIEPGSRLMPILFFGLTIGGAIIGGILGVLIMEPTRWRRASRDQPPATPRSE